MSSRTLQRCSELRAAYYPQTEWPGLLYEAAVAESARRDGVLLEIGCGREGRRLKRMATGFRFGVGLDMEATSAPNGDAPARLVIGDAHGICLRDECVDVIAMANVAEHLTDPDIVMRECLRVLKPAGRLVVMTVNRRFPAIAAARLLPHGVRKRLNRMASGTNEEDTFPAYYRMNTGHELRASAAAVGFEEIRLTHLSHHPHYLMFSVAAYRIGMIAERILRPIAGLRHMILGVFAKPVWCGKQGLGEVKAC